MSLSKLAVAVVMMVVPILWSSGAMADETAPSPAPETATAFGIEMGVSTLGEIKENYPVEDVGVNPLMNGPTIEISGEEFNFEGLYSLTVVFNEQEQAVGVLARIAQDRFPFLFDMLTDKYELVSDEYSQTGERYVDFRSEGMKIELDVFGPVVTTVAYFDESFTAAIEREKQARQDDHGHEHSEVADQRGREADLL